MEREKFTANRATRRFRAIWNTASRANEEPAQCPVVTVTMNKECRRRVPIAWDALPSWQATVETIQQPTRRDLQRFVLFTGLRSSDAKSVHWEHVDFESGTICRPLPKGGVDRAFTVPASAFVLDMLRRRKDVLGRRQEKAFGSCETHVQPGRRRRGSVRMAN